MIGEKTVAGLVRAVARLGFGERLVVGGRAEQACSVVPVDAAAARRVVAPDEARERSRVVAAEEDRRFRASPVAVDPVTGRPLR